MIALSKDDRLNLTGGDFPQWLCTEGGEDFFVEIASEVDRILAFPHNDLTVIALRKFTHRSCFCHCMFCELLFDGGR